MIGGRDHQLLKEISLKMNFKSVDINWNLLFLITIYLALNISTQRRSRREFRLAVAERAKGCSVCWETGFARYLADLFALHKSNLLCSREQKVDLFLGDAAVTYERTQDLDFSFFTVADSVAFITHSPRPLSEAWALVRPFHWQVYKINAAKK